VTAPAVGTTPLPRDEFAVTQRLTYLNHAAVGVLPESSRRALEALLLEHSRAGVLGTFPHDDKMPEYRRRIGALIGARGEEIAVVSSTSAAANIVAAGIDWRDGDELILADDEFPANAIPWLALRKRGVQLRWIESRNERLTPDVLARALTPRTRAVAVSWVSYHDGYRHDLAGLAQAAHDAGALLCVDVIQGLGGLALDVRETGIDAAYGGAGKWMLGLHGAGMLYVGEGLNERIELAAPGWRSQRDIWAFSDFEQPFATDASRFEAGTPNYAGALSLASSAALLSSAGTAHIERHVLALTDRLCDGLTRIGARVVSQRSQGVSSGIVTFTVPGIDSVELGRKLQREGIVTTYRSNGIRVSPHGYNTAEEVDQLLDFVKSVSRS
jgi:cysteine desulfurase/selenocysteine lyase